MLKFSPNDVKWPFWLGAIFALWLCLLLCFPISHNDIWWHLKCGQWVWAHHSFPAYDPFSYSSPDTPWLKASWLFNLLAWLVFSAGGLKALIGAKLAMALLTGTVALFYGRRRGASPGISVALLALAFLATRFNWTERPQTPANLLFVIALFLLDSPRSKARTAALFAVGIFWSNLNPSAVLLPAFAAALSLGLYLEGEGFDWLASLSCFAGTLLSPQWGSDYLDVLNLFGHQQAMRQLVTEWKAPVFVEQPALAALFLLLPLVALQAWREKKWCALFVLIPAAIGAWRVSRMIPFFAFPMAIWSAVLLSPVFQRSSPKLAVLPAALLIVHGIYISSFDRLWGKTLDGSQFPVQASEFLAANRPIGHLGNLYRDGSYLLYRLGPETKVFIDSREIIYPPRVFQAALVLESASPDWNKVAKEYEFSCMLLPRRSRLYAPVLIDPSWKLVYFDDEFVILADDAELKRHSGSWPWYQGVNLLDMELRKPTKATTLALEQRLKKQGPDAQGLYLLSLAYLNENNVEAAKKSLQACLLLDSSQPMVRDLIARLSSNHPR